MFNPAYTKRMKQHKRLFYQEPERSLPVLAAFTGIALTGAALLYPGGTPFTGTNLYHPLQNTISDLGMLISYAGMRTGYLQLGLFFVGMLSAAGFLFADAYRYRQYRGFAAVLAGLLCLVTLIPSDIAGSTHNYLFFALVIALTGHSLVLRRYVAATVLGAFIGIILWIHPSTNDAERIWIATGQKIVVLTVGISALLDRRRYR
jgi:hypothetical protein